MPEQSTIIASNVFAHAFRRPHKKVEKKWGRNPVIEAYLGVVLLIETKNLELAAKWDRLKKIYY